MLSNDVIKRFCKDYSLPIQIYNPDFIDYYVELYDRIYDTKAKYKLFKDTINKFENENEFLAYGNKLTDSVVSYIKQTDGYNELCSCNMSEVYPVLKNIEGVNFVKTVNIYNPNNSGKHFISYDMCKANYQALYIFNSDIVANKPNYEAFISKFTDNEYFKNSKHIRQATFGMLNHERIAHMERYLMQKVLYFLFDIGYTSDDIITFTTDEIIVQDSRPDKHSESTCTNLSNLIKEYTSNLDIKVDFFKLNYIGHDTYVKEFTYKDPVFKGGSSVYMPQIYKHYFGMPLTDRDLCFLYEKQIAKFLNPLEWD